MGILHNISIPYFKYNSSVFGSGTTDCCKIDRKLIYLIKIINKSFHVFFVYNIHNILVLFSYFWRSCYECLNTPTGSEKRLLNKTIE